MSCPEDDMQGPVLPEDGIVQCDALSPRDQRAAIFHLLYSIDSLAYEVSLEAIVDNMSRGFQCVVAVDGPLFEKARSIIEQREELDTEIKPLLHNWRFDRLGTCTRLILRIAIWEFLNSDLDPSVIINEAVELAKCFAEADAHKFINGLLDEWARNHGKITGEKPSAEEPSPADTPETDKAE